MAYIREYTPLGPQERRQLAFKRRFKAEQPEWDDSMVLLTRLVRERLPSRADVLDFGCGHGNFVIDECGGVFADKVGYDVAASAVADNVSCGRIVLGDGLTLPFADASFDLVLSLWAIEHLADPSRSFGEISRVLRPGGMFAFVTPNARSLLIRARRLMREDWAKRLLRTLYGREDEDVFGVHYRANDPESVKRLAHGAAFAVEHLVENADPSYTSFGTASYLASKAFSALPLAASKPHLIVLLRKVL